MGQVLKIQMPVKTGQNFMKQSIVRGGEYSCKSAVIIRKRMKKVERTSFFDIPRTAHDRAMKENEPSAFSKPHSPPSHMYREDERCPKDASLQSAEHTYAEASSARSTDPTTTFPSRKTAAITTSGDEMQQWMEEMSASPPLTALGTGARRT